MLVGFPPVFTHRREFAGSETTKAMGRMMIIFGIPTLPIFSLKGLWPDRLPVICIDTSPNTKPNLDRKGYSRVGADD